MTKQEITGNRDLYFNRWIRNNLKDSSNGLAVMDIDFIFREFNKNCLIMTEVKTRNKDMSYSQLEVYRLEDRIHKLAHKEGLIKYRGFYFIKFTHTSFEDGNCIISKPFDSESVLIIPMDGVEYKCKENEKVIAIDDLKKLLNM